MSEPRPVTSIGVFRAGRLLQDMIEHPFFIIVFTDEGPQGISKGLAPDAVEVVGEVVQAILTRDE